MNSYLLFKSLHLIAVISWIGLYIFLEYSFTTLKNNNEIITSVFKVMGEKIILLYYDTSYDI